MHLIPGFNNYKVLNSALTSENSTSFSMYLNLDKSVTFFALALLYPSSLGRGKTFKWFPFILTLLVLFSLFPIGVYFKVIKVDFTFPDWIALFIFNNLLFTSVTEEALFRGFIQQGLSKKLGWFVGLSLSSILFGLAHFSGGTPLILFATIAGACYGLVFHLTGRLWVAVLVHFAFNLTHLVFFTYPLASK